VRGGGKIRGSDESRGAGVFLSFKRDDFSATSQPQIFTKFGHDTRKSMSHQNVPERIFENFSFRGHILPTNPKLKEVKQGPYSDQPIPMFTTGYSPRSREFLWSVNFFCIRRTVSELRGIKVPQFSHFCLFFHRRTKRLKGTLRRPAYSPGATLQNACGYSV